MKEKSCESVFEMTLTFSYALCREGKCDFVDQIWPIFLFLSEALLRGLKAPLIDENADCHKIYKPFKDNKIESIIT